MERSGAVTLFHNDSPKLTTSAAGIAIAGNLSATNGNFSGSITAVNGNFSGIVTATDINSASDINLKKNIRQVEDSLNKILQIRGVNFEWKESGRASVGVIAQEVEKVLPELISGDDAKVVNYNGLIGVLIEAVKEQQKQIEELKKLINN
jgi:hypothetical protein